MRCFRQSSTKAGVARPNRPGRAATRSLLLHHSNGSGLRHACCVALASLVVFSLFSRPLAAQPPQPPEAQSPQAQTADAPEPEATEPADSKEPPLPKLEDMPTPTAAELLHEPPVDWVVLKTYDVIVVEPVYPRPHTLEEMQKKIDAHNDKLKNTPVNEVDQWRAERERLNYLRLTLPGDKDQPEYQLHLRFIREIIHHEDLMLRRVNESLDNRDLRGAFDLVMRLQRRHADWPGVEEARNRLVFLDAEKRAEAGEWESAFAFLERLHERVPEFPDLRKRLGEVADRLIADAVEDEDFRRARHFLNRLVQREPQHEIATKWQARLLARAEQILTKSQTATDEKRHDAAVALADKAARVWPATPRLPNVHQRAARRFQRLDVGVVQFPGESTAYPFPTDADLRHKHLTQLPLFEVESVDDAAHYRSRFFEQWEPIDLGRRVAFTLRQSVSPWQSQPLLTATALAGELRARADPYGPQYDARLDNHLNSIAVLSPFEFEVGFAEVPLRVESLFAFAAPGERFRVHEQSNERVSYRRSVPEPDGLSQFHIAEVVERKYGSYGQSVQALVRGEVALLPRVDRRDVHPLRRDGRFFLQQYAVPTTHLLQFHPERRALQHRELRRALAYAVDRSRILRDELLPGGSEADTPTDRAEQQGWGRITTAPWPQQHKAYNALVEPHPHDPVLAAALAVAAGKQLDGKLEPLRLVCPPGDEARAVAESLIRDWAAIGIPVQLVPDSEQNARWDIVYRTIRSADPYAELWPLLTLQASTQIEALAHLPDWLRQELIRLEQAHDWTTAESLLRNLHAHLHAEVQLVPLWETDEFLALRKNVHGVPERPVHAYQNVERWTADPWYPRETP